MEFGKTAQFNEVKYVNYPDDIKNFLIRDIQNSNVEFFSGAPLWAQESWKGNWYPAEASSGNYLSHYSKLFNSIELNSSFYHLPNIETIKKWTSVVDKEFKFCPKFPKNVSHTDLNPIRLKDKINNLDMVLKNLGDNLGHAFMQLPEHIDFDYFGNLKKFVENTTHIPRFFIEFRHPSWFNENTLKDEVFTLLESYKLGAVITDVSGRRAIAHSSCPSLMTMVRFIANDDPATDNLRSELWINKLNGLYEQGLKTCYFFFHTPDNHRSPDLAHKFLNQFADLTGWEGIIPIKASNKQLSMLN